MFVAILHANDEGIHRDETCRIRFTTLGKICEVLYFDRSEQSRKKKIAPMEEFTSKILQSFFHTLEKRPSPSLQPIITTRDLAIQSRNAMG